MERMIYLAMSGAKQVTLNLASNNNNLANASTTGFRADLDAFRALPVNGPGLPSRVYTSDVRTGVDLQAGEIVATGRDLDVAINGRGYLAILAPDGNEAYTRAGDLKVTAQGQILNGAGHPLLGNDGPVAVPPFERIQIGTDGTITVQPLGQADNALAVVDRIKLVAPADTELYKGADGLLRLKSGAPVPADAAVSLVTGSIETSNVNIIEAMVNMIELSRLFEMNIKMMKTAQENETASNRLLRLA